MISSNQYQYPVNCGRLSYDESPAHTGRLKYSVDFIIPEGTPIKAALSGVVVDVKQDSDDGGPDKRFDSLGNYIEIEHRCKEYSIYEHIKKNGSKVKIGDKVKKGQVIGLSGNTGWVAQLGPHLHFDVHKYHEPFGPKDYETIEIRWKRN